jgi:phage recombination protein Bet
MSTALVVKNEITGWESKIDLVRRNFAKDATTDELEIFFHQCRKTGLDPLAKQIYFQKRGGKMTIITGIDGYRLVADRTGKYAGNDDPIFEELPGAANPQVAKVTVYKIVDGQRCAFTASARWSQYYPGDTLGFMWKKMPHLMLGKCAEALALRKAFPAELSGVYTAEEMEQAEQPLVNNAAKAPHLKSHVEGQADEVVIGVVEDMFSNKYGHFYTIGEKTCFTEDALIVKKLAGAHGLKVELLTHAFTEEGKTYQKINNVIGIEVEDTKSELKDQLSASLQQVAAHEAGVPAGEQEAAYNDETGRAAGVVTKVYPAVGKKPLGIILAGVNFSTFDKKLIKRLENSASHYVVLTYVLKDGKYRNISDVEKCGGIDYRNSLAGASEIPDDKDIPF